MNRVIQRIFYSHNTLRHQTTPRGLGSSGLQHMSYVRPYEAHLTDPTTLPCHTVASPRLLYSPFQALYCADPMARRQRSSSELSSSAALHRTRQHGSARSQQASFGRRGARTPAMALMVMVVHILQRGVLRRSETEFCAVRSAHASREVLDRSLSCGRSVDAIGTLQRLMSTASVLEHRAHQRRQMKLVGAHQPRSRSVPGDRTRDAIFSHRVFLWVHQ